MKKKFRKNKNFNSKQSSFYFDDFLETNKKKQSLDKKNFFHDRIFLLFFLFFSLILIFSFRIIHVSLSEIKLSNQTNTYKKFTLLRRDIVDRNGVLISRNIKSFHAAVNPKLISNEDNFLIKLKFNFPELKTEEIKKKLKEVNIFI